MTTDNQPPSESGASEVLRELSGVDDVQARSIVNMWREWQITEVLDTITELQRAAETDRSLEFDSLFRAATSFPVPEVRLESVRALSEGGSFKIAQSLIAVLERDEVSEIRAAAAQSLHGFSDPAQSRNVSKSALTRIANSLRNALHVDEPMVRGKSLIALAALHDDEAADLIDTMFDEAVGTAPLMADVLTAMGETNDRSWLPTIEDAFFSNDPIVRIAAVLAFGKIGSDDDVESLSEPFDDHTLEVQIATVNALQNIGSPQAREMLGIAAEDSSEPAVQQTAQAALDFLKAEDDLIYAISPTMVERGLFGVPTAGQTPTRDMSRYDAPTEEGWANVDPEGEERDAAEVPDDIGEDYEDYLESDEFFRDSNTN
ncbi:MAG: hypothetical protein OXC83_05890 [Chloroflexi bacterium]|nr:hypothetical protein [Chloroflexota bacterium]